MTTASANRKTAVQAKTISEAGGISAPSVRSAKKTMTSIAMNANASPTFVTMTEARIGLRACASFCARQARKKARVPARKIKKELFPERKHRRHEVAQIDAFFRRPAPETGLAAQFHDHVPYKTAEQADDRKNKLHIDGENAALLVPGICRQKAPDGQRGKRDEKEHDGKRCPQGRLHLPFRLFKNIERKRGIRRAVCGQFRKSKAATGAEPIPFRPLSSAARAISHILSSLNGNKPVFERAYRISFCFITA